MNVPNELIGNPRSLNITTRSIVENKTETLHIIRIEKTVDHETCVNGRRVLQSVGYRKFWRHKTTGRKIQKENESCMEMAYFSGHVHLTHTGSKIDPLKTFAGKWNR